MKAKTRAEYIECNNGKARDRTCSLHTPWKSRERIDCTKINVGINQ
jgi:hypothetical protein